MNHMETMEQLEAEREENMKIEDVIKVKIFL